jgi:hypothetical protein
MKNIASLVLILCGLLAWAQPDDEIVYYTDSDVKDSRFGIALNFNPYFTDLRLINDDAESSQFTSFSEVNSSGTFQLDYQLDLFYELNNSFQIGIGVARAFGGYTINQVQVPIDSFSVTADDEVRLSMWSIPIKINFSTSISDVFDLEVLPSFEINFLDSYQASLDFADPSIPDTVLRPQNLRDVNYSVGIALGGTYWFADQWGVFVRGSIRYMLNDMVESDWPRETLINFGANTGVRFRF